MARFLRFVAAIVLPCLPLLTWASGSREVRLGAPPAWVRPTDVPSAPKTPDGSVQRHYLLFETQHDVATDASYTHAAYRLLTEQGVADGSQLTIDFDPSYETVTLHSAHLIRNGRVIDQLELNRIKILQRESDLEYLVYRGDLSAVLIFEDVRVGDIVEFAYTREGANPVFGGKYLAVLTLDWGTPITVFRTRVLIPKDRQIMTKALGTKPLKPTVKTHDDMTEMDWVAHDVPATTDDARTPEWFDDTPRVILTEYPSWESVVNWALPMYARPRASTGLRERAEAIKQTAHDDEERALLALKYVQSGIRYLGVEEGVSSHQPSACEDVMRRGFGDCKDKARLLTNLLQELGFDAAPVLVHTTRKHTLATWPPSPFAFNHVIVELRLGGQTFLLDPTLTDQAGGLRLRHTARYQAGLVIRAGTKEITSWPASDNDLLKTSVEEEYRVPAFDAKADFSVRTTYAGRSAEHIRSFLTSATKEQVGKDYLNFYARYFPEITQSAPVRWTDMPERNEFVVEEHYTLPPLFSQTKDGVWLADFHPSNLDEYLASPGAGGRKAPLAVTYPLALHIHVHVAVPETWNVPFSENAINGPAFTYARRGMAHDHEVDWNYDFRTTADSVDPEHFTEYARALKSVKDDTDRRLTYTPATSKAAAPPPYTINWAMAALALFWVVVAAVGTVACLRHKPSAAEPPLLDGATAEPPRLDGARSDLEGLGGWLILVGFGVVVRPVMLVATIFPSFTTYFNLSTWRLLTTPGTEYAKPAFAIVAPVEMSLNLVLLFASCVIVALYFGRRKLFPRVIIGILVVGVLSAGFQIWAHRALNGSSADATIIRNFVQAIVGSLIWIPYFCVSKRVRYTFVR